MEPIKNFDELIAHLSSKGEKKRVAVVCATDPSTQYAVGKALEGGFITATFVGGRAEIEANAELMAQKDNFTIMDATDQDDAAAKAVALVREGHADVLMKGLINTDNMLRAVLNKETGILPKGRVLTHIAAAQIPTYKKILFFTDAAVIPYPTQEQRIEQVRYVADMARSFGVEEPRIALIHSSEKVQEKHFPFTVGYPEIIEMANKGEFGKCIVDGPTDLKCACSIEALKKKGLSSPINGEADALIFPDIEAGNAFYKAVTLFSHASMAAALRGPLAPVVLTSRGDSKESKLYSLALAVITANEK